MPFDTFRVAKYALFVHKRIGFAHKSVAFSQLSGVNNALSYGLYGDKDGIRRPRIPSKKC